MIDCRLLPLECNSGSEAMASDELVLELAEEGLSTLRFYTWNEPTVSLGYFQPYSLLSSSTHLSGLPWVRRATGGEALVHHHELTYALGLPLEIAGQKTSHWQAKIHIAIQRALASMGITSTTMNHPELRNDPTHLLCFHHQTPQDLIIEGKKIVGSAQRKKKKSIIQHGGILLAQSPFTPSLPGILELTNIPILPDYLAGAIVEEIKKLMGWTFSPSVWTEQEKTRILTHQQVRYSNSLWNLKR